MNIVTVKINDFEYSLKGTEDAEYIASLAQYVNEKVASIKNNNSKLGTGELSVLAAVNIVDELFKFNVDYKKMKEQLQNVKDDYAKIEEENNQLKNHSKTYIKNEERFKGKIDEYKEQIRKLENDIVNIKDEKDNEILQLKDKNSKLSSSLEMMGNNNRKEIRAIEDRYADEIKSLREVHSKDFNNLKYKYDKDIETIGKEYENKFETSVINHNNEVENIRSKYEKQIEIYKSNIEFMEKTHLYKESAFKEKIQELEVKSIEENELIITALNEEIDKLKGKLKNTMEQNNFMEQKGKMYIKEIKNLKNQNKEIRANLQSHVNKY